MLHWKNTYLILYIKTSFNFQILENIRNKYQNKILIKYLNNMQKWSLLTQNIPLYCAIFFCKQG